MGSTSKRPELSGSVVGHGVYHLEELHFHWGDDNFEGTEHSIDNYFGSAERWDCSVDCNLTAFEV
ncbi:unnamed protein product [Oppiella nova]|uniref:Alpha-carbonic anhydrase domain-containing protein n=1 Tax=Oppiella nova TaxID=334625 RepID=A0A7R9QP67_9ACAR|nr:unnamed protein product [Oppiella nova]CAG2170486.1 unnamed protein product [Oppiella nova]